MILAIETSYKGYRFRSRLEARWAVFFDSLGVKWEYEKEGFHDGSITYLPDFWLPDVSLRGSAPSGLWVEIKADQAALEQDQKKLGVIRGDLVAFWGLPPGNDDGDSGWQFGERGWDNCMRFMKCYAPQCGAVKVEFAESNYEYCGVCGAHCNDEHRDLIKAALAAKAARFEHGERP